MEVAELEEAQMRARNFDTKRYARLLAKALPRPIESDEECERLTAVIEPMMNRDHTPEESALFQLLVGLVQEYEDRRYPSRQVPPDEMLRYLLENSGMKQTELGQLLGTSKGYTSNIVSGKRPIGKEHAKILAERFKLSVEAFL
jgi:HTH-type transcriptional regulator/antitoxin HigA